MKLTGTMNVNAHTAAVITPSPDPISMLALLIPLYLFYEGAIIVSRLMKR